MPNDTNKQWSNDFYRLVEDYEYGVIGSALSECLRISSNGWFRK